MLLSGLQGPQSSLSQCSLLEQPLGSPVHSGSAGWGSCVNNELHCKYSFDTKAFTSKKKWSPIPKQHHGEDTGSWYRESARKWLNLSYRGREKNLKNPQNNTPNSPPKETTKNPNKNLAEITRKNRAEEELRDDIPSLVRPQMGKKGRKLQKKIPTPSYWVLILTKLEI